jgi:hypothetical protein
MVDAGLITLLCIIAVFVAEIGVIVLLDRRKGRAR